MPKLLLPLAALLAVGGSAAGAGVYLATRGETVEEVLRPPTLEASPTPAVTATVAATPIPSPTTAPEGWTVYTDPELGFSFPYPLGLTLSVEFFDLQPEDAKLSVRQRTLIFRNAAGATAFGVGIVPNPNNLTVEEWVKAYPGWPSEPQAVTIGGEQGLLFPINQVGDPYPTIYFSHSGFIFIIGGDLSGRGFPSPGITEADFQRLSQGFSFPQ